MADSHDYRRSVVAGILRGDTREKQVEVNEKGEFLFGQGLPPYVEMARLGNGFSATATAAVAGLVARPDTTAAVTLWNGELAGGKCYVIDRIFTHQLVSTVAEARFGLYACVHPSGMTKPATAPIAASATNLTGNTGKTYNGRAVFDIGATVVDNGWYPWGTSVSVEPSGVLPGGLISVEVGGRLIVPPSAAISIQVVASLAADTFCSGLSWYEVELDLQ